MRDDKTITRRDRVVGYMGTRASSFTLAWLASHRDRLRTLIFAGHRLSVLLIWDSQGNRKVPRTEMDRAAIEQLTYGRVAAFSTKDQPEEDT